MKDAMQDKHMEPDDTSALTREERSIYAQVSRRGFMGATDYLEKRAGLEPTPSSAIASNLLTQHWLRKSQ